MDIFPNGLNHGFGPKIAIFPTFFQAIQAKKMSFTIFQNEKTPFQAIKTKSLKSRKIDIFLKGSTYGFGPKVAIFPIFIFRQYRPKKMSFTKFQKKKCLSKLQKQKVQKVEKFSFFQRGNPWFWSKNAHFSNFFFSQYRPGKCLLQYSRTTNCLSML